MPGSGFNWTPASSPKPDQSATAAGGGLGESVVGGVTSLGVALINALGGGQPETVVNVEGGYYEGGEEEDAGAGAGMVETGGGFPWGWVVGGVAVGGLILYLVARK